MKRMLLIRHGQSEWNALGRWQGQADPPLSPLGEVQAKRAVAALEPIGIEAIGASNLMRAQQTASTIGAALGLLPVHTEPRLSERHAGEWSGLTKADIERDWPGFLEAHRYPPGYEPDDQLLPRVLAGLDAMFGLVGDTLAVVAHGGVIYMLEKHFGQEFARIGNLGSRWFSRSPDGALSIGDRFELLAETTVPDQI